MSKIKATVSRSPDPSKSDHVNLNVERDGILQVITLSSPEEASALKKLIVYAKAMLEKKLS